MKVIVIGGGTSFAIRPHLHLSAPAYGETTNEIWSLCEDQFPEGTKVTTYFTRMAGGKYRNPDGFTRSIESNADVARLIDEVVLPDMDIKVLFMPVALCDFDAVSIESFKDDVDLGIVHAKAYTGRHLPRLKSADYMPHVDSGPDGDGLSTPTLRISLTPAEKIIQRIRKTRKDIFLVGFKTTTGATPDEQFELGLKLLKSSSCNLVLANDIVTRLNMTITPEQARYHVTTDRGVALAGLVKIAESRCDDDFTRSYSHPRRLNSMGLARGAGFAASRC